ncbi:MAG: hypothetical protein KC414_11455, partial [Romboutsia sp.]|nr:hypothetical protein [Romboutsia sp.]
MFSNTGESHNLGYWYNGFGSHSGTSELPPQALPSSKKNDKWKYATMDALERIGVTQLRENLKFKDFYRMVEGKLAFSEISEVIPQLRELEETLDDLDIPTFIKHYDLVGIIVNAMVGEYMQNSDKFNVTNVDEISTNEYERDKSDLVFKYIKEQFDKELNFRLIRQGINPNPESLNIEDPEQLQAYIQQLQQKKQEMTPPEIEQFMNTKWRTKASIWGEHTLEADRERFYLDEMDRDELVDFLLTGRCFRHYRIGYDYYRPETWSPLNTFFSQDLDTKYVQDGEYVGRVHYYTPSQIINKYGHFLSKKQKEDLLGGNTYYESNYGSNTGSFNSAKQVLNKHFGETHIVPHKNYYDYNFLLDIQDEFGVPLGEKTIKAKDGTEKTIPTFLPSRHSNLSEANYLAQLMREDLVLRSDLLQVTEAYWVSYKKIGYLTYMTNEGRMTQDIVTDDILIDFLKEKGIKQLSNKSLYEVEEEAEPNTIVWDYIPEVWKGIKINEGNSNFREAIYLEVEPLEFQIKGDSNVYDVKLPVSGIVDSSLAIKLQPFQVGHNVAMNQVYNMMEKEIGMFFIFDINFLPSEFKEWGDSEETLVHLTNLVKDVGMFPVDSSKQNVRDGGGFNQFGVQNLSYASQIAERFQVADNFKYRAFEQVGFNPQRLGAPSKYETREGVVQSQNASYAQTEIYFDKFSSYKKRALEMHLNVAQYAQKSDKDITVFYTKSDSSQAFLKFTDPYFQLRKLGILPVSNSKRRKELENFKSYLLNTNTLGSDEMSLAKLFTSDTMVELIESARAERVRRQQEGQVAHDRQMELLDKQAELEDQKAVAEWQREEYSKQKDRENKIEVERIDALGRAADNNANQQSLDFINKNADLALKKEKQSADIK